MENCPREKYNCFSCTDESNFRKFQEMLYSFSQPSIKYFHRHLKTVDLDKFISLLPDDKYEIGQVFVHTIIGILHLSEGNRDWNFLKALLYRTLVKIQSNLTWRGLFVHKDRFNYRLVVITKGRSSGFINSPSMCLHKLEAALEILGACGIKAKKVHFAQTTQITRESRAKALLQNLEQQPLQPGTTRNPNSLQSFCLDSLRHRVNLPASKQTLVNGGIPTLFHDDLKREQMFDDVSGTMEQYFRNQHPNGACHGCCN